MEATENTRFGFIDYLRGNKIKNLLGPLGRTEK